MVAVKHKKVTAIADDPAYDVSADEWNDDHAKGDIADAINAFTIATLNTLVSDATLDDSGASRTPTAHDLGGALHNADTLADLNAKISDATLLDTTAIQYKTGALHAAADHQNAGALEIRLDDFKATEDNADLNSSITAHGLLKKLDNTATNYMDGTGNWSVPAGGGGTNSTIFANAGMLIYYTYGTRYLDLTYGSGTTEGGQKTAVPAGTMKKMYVYIDTNTLDGNCVIKLRVNGADPSPNLTVTVGATATGVFTSTQDVAVADEDLINSAAVESASSGSLVGSIVYVFEPS